LGCSKESKHLLFSEEKRSKKDFITGMAARSPGTGASDKSFLVLFFKKEPLASFLRRLC
jgi:hypothetical protein